MNIQGYQGFDPSPYIVDICRCICHEANRWRVINSPVAITGSPPFGEEILSWLRMCDSPFIVKLYETYNGSSAQEKRANGRPLSRDGFLQRSKWRCYPAHRKLLGESRTTLIFGRVPKKQKQENSWLVGALLLQVGFALWNVGSPWVSMGLHGSPWVSGPEHLYLLLELALGGELYATCLGQLRSSSPRAIGDDLVGDWNHGILNDFPWKVGKNGL